MELLNPIAPEVQNSPQSNKSALPIQTNQKITPTSTVVHKAQNHDFITKLPTFAERGTAIAKRLDAVKADPKYQALSDEHKAKVRADLYNKLVPKSYAGFHLPAPDKNTWVAATGRDTSFKSTALIPGASSEKLSESYKDKSALNDFYERANAGFTKAFDNMDLFGTKAANRAWTKAWGIAEHFQSVPGYDHAKIQAKMNQFETTKVLKNHLNAVNNKIQSDDFWLETHPSHTVLGSLGNMTGETIATLPLYEALGAVGLGGKLGETIKVGKPFVSGVGGEVGARTVQLARSSLTEKLAQSKVGGWVAKRFIDASDGYLASLVSSGGSTKEANAGAVGFAVGNPLIEGVGSVASKAIKVASAPLIKKWTANTIAMAGKPFAHEAAESAYSEMQPLDWWLKNGKEAGISEYKNAHTLGHDIVIYPKTEDAGHFVKDGTAYPYDGPRQKQTLYNTLTQDAMKLREVEDPVMAKIHKAEKVSIDSISLAKFGKPLAELSEEQHTDVIVARHQLIEEAANEAPAHLPDLMKDEVSQNIAEARKANPHLDALMKQDEQMFGAKFVDDVAEDNIESVSKQTGISNASQAAKKTTKSNVATDSGIAKINPKQFASLNSNTVSYLTAPRNRVEVASTITDRSKAGLNKFIDLLKKSSNDSIHFEDPAHLMLFHYGNRKQLPEALNDSLLYRIRQTRGYENAKPADIKKEADWLHVHLLKMARTGHWTSEGNMFRSTKLGGPMSWTPWQNEIANESDSIDIKSIARSLKQHPHALAGFQTTIKALQSTRVDIKTPEEYLKYMRALSESSAAIKEHAATGNAFIFNK